MCEHRLSQPSRAQRTHWQSRRTRELCLLSSSGGRCAVTREGAGERADHVLHRGHLRSNHCGIRCASVTPPVPAAFGVEGHHVALGCLRIEDNNVIGFGPFIETCMLHKCGANRAQKLLTSMENNMQPTLSGSGKTRLRDVDIAGFTHAEIGRGNFERGIRSLPEQIEIIQVLCRSRLESAVAEEELQHGASRIKPTVAHERCGQHVTGIAVRICDPGVLSWDVVHEARSGFRNPVAVVFLTLQHHTRVNNCVVRPRKKPGTALSKMGGLINRVQSRSVLGGSNKFSY
mmetsp:Transcript_11991/g.27661  ORF Transcript_11991/g.27661 Transcript_11991/m.27661 type:complete len:288 (+) Transcript_11991:224-1087(+)